MMTWITRQGTGGLIMDVFSLIKVSKCRSNLPCFSELFAAREPARLGVSQDQSTMREEHKCEGRMPCGLGAWGGVRWGGFTVIEQ